MATERSGLILQRVEGEAEHGRGGVGRGALFPAALAAVVVVFLLAPWPFEHKAHAALHGLCAQIPSHTFRFDGRALPFDARMTGIYGGFLTTAVVLAMRGRLRSFRFPPTQVLVALGLGVAAMGIDGTNSLLVDLGLPHLYAPDNRLRLATGLLAGVALAAVLAFVLATTLWKAGRWDRAPIDGLGELGVVIGAQAPFALLVLSGLAPLYAPLALFLLAAAVAVVGSLMLVVVVLVRHGDRAFDGPGQLQVPATAALVLAVATMAAFSAGRFLLERAAGPSPLT